MSGFAHINTWIFDLDNTLYPPSCNLFDQISHRMTEFIMAQLGLGRAQSAKLRHSYYKTYGTTLRGLMLEHGMEPHGFLDYVHNIDYGAVAQHKDLRHALENLPGRKFIFTAGTTAHAHNVLQSLGCANVFEDIFDIAAANFIPKPDARPYDAFLTRHKVNPTQAAFFEDLAENLNVPRAKGMTTILVGNHDAVSMPAHIDYVTNNLTEFLNGVIK
jgi:putative hydrolase of the HAD superfamily